MPLDVFAISVLRALVEVALFVMLGQGALYAIAGARRERNPIYKLFRLITSPVIRFTRAILPKVIIDRHVPLIAFFLVFWLWIVLRLAKQQLCAAHGFVC
ncbi:MAG TPA: hypothetical protein VNM24_09105 [Burkholderiales bacterium]|jgi:uncharacterized protein YggT (Ycf19 family)|nr:hypothetical protein [Burkholderiales bacterium]